MQCPDCLRNVEAGATCGGCGYVMPTELPAPPAPPAPAPRARSRAPGARKRHDRLVHMKLDDRQHEVNRGGFADARAALAEAAARADERDRARALELEAEVRAELEGDHGLPPADRTTDVRPNPDLL